MSQAEDNAKIAGRFAPLTQSGLQIIRQALVRSAKVDILIADADASPSSRLPWSFAERREMIQAALGSDAHKFSFHAAASGVHAHEIAHDKGLVAAYLRGDDISAALPAPVAKYLVAFRQTQAFANMAEEARYIDDYKRSWAVAPYPVTFVTVDTVIVHADPQNIPHVLLIRRGGLPGKGLFALPGGFIEPDEYLQAAALRELREETGLVLSDDDALSKLKGRHVFDDPERSARGRTITHAFHFEVPAGELPRVEGFDDAAEARWIPFAELDGLAGQFFEDHGRILRHFAIIKPSGLDDRRVRGH